MNAGGDAAEQVVRMSLEGVEVAAKITGEGAKGIAILLAAALKEEHKTAGKSRLTNMIKSGKELKVFSIQNKDLKRFSQEAKRYGVLYCVLKDKNDKGENAAVDVIARAEDASKIQRIMERFEFAKVDVATVTEDIARSRNPQSAKTEKSPLSEQNLTRKSEPKSQEQGGQVVTRRDSVREKLARYKVKAAREKSLDKTSKDILMPKKSKER